MTIAVQNVGGSSRMIFKMPAVKYLVQSALDLSLGISKIKKTIDYTFTQFVTTNVDVSLNDTIF